jgi:hypothetical protein
MAEVRRGGVGADPPPPRRPRRRAPPGPRQRAAMHEGSAEQHRAGARRLAFASPLNKYSPLAPSTYDPSRLPEKSLIRHLLPPGTAAPGVQEEKRACAPDDGGVNDSELPDSPAAIIAHSGQMIAATANLLGAWQRAGAAGEDAAPAAATRRSPALRGSEASGWAALLGEFAVGGRVTFAQFQSALVAGDECKVLGLTEVREDAEDLWVALVGDRGAAGAVSEIAELLSIACSERAASRAPGPPTGASASLQRSGPTARGSHPDVASDEDMCNVDTDSLDGDAAFAVATERELRESMVRLQDFIGTQPRASGEAIASLESFLATEPAARGLAVPPRSATQQEYATAETRPAADSAHRAAASHSLSSSANQSTDSPTATSSRASVADWLLTPPSTQTCAAAATSAELAVAGEGASPAQEQQDESVATPREREASVQRSIPLRSSPGVRPSNQGWPEAGAADKEASAAGKEASATDNPLPVVSPQPAPPPQPHLKTPQRHSPQRAAPLAHHESLWADAQGDSPSAPRGAAYSEGASGASAGILDSDSPGSRALGTHLTEG